MTQAEKLALLNGISGRSTDVDLLLDSYTILHMLAHTEISLTPDQDASLYNVLERLRQRLRGERVLA